MSYELCWLKICFVLLCELVWMSIVEKGDSLVSELANVFNGLEPIFVFEFSHRYASKMLITMSKFNLHIKKELSLNYSVCVLGVFDMFFCWAIVFGLCGMFSLVLQRQGWSSRPNLFFYCPSINFASIFFLMFDDPDRKSVV